MTTFFDVEVVADFLMNLGSFFGGRPRFFVLGLFGTFVVFLDEETKKKYTNCNNTFEELDAIIKADVAAKNFGKIGSAYGISKAALNALTLVQAKAYPNLKVVCLTPGFVATNLTKTFNSSSKITPEQGCVSSLKCLLGSVETGCFYGSDGLRSPMLVSRDPGMPEYQGEENPDPKKYSN